MGLLEDGAAKGAEFAMDGVASIAQCVDPLTGGAAIAPLRLRFSVRLMGRRRGILDIFCPYSICQLDRRLPQHFPTCVPY